MSRYETLSNFLKSEFDYDSENNLSESVIQLNKIIELSEQGVKDHYKLSSSISNSKIELQAFFRSRIESGLKFKCFSNYYCENELEELETIKRLLFETDLNNSDTAFLSKRIQRDINKKISRSFDAANSMVDDFFEKSHNDIQELYSKLEKANDILSTNPKKSSKLNNWKV